MTEYDEYIKKLSSYEWDKSLIIINSIHSFNNSLKTQMLQLYFHTFEKNIRLHAAEIHKTYIFIIIEDIRENSQKLP